MDDVRGTARRALAELDGVFAGLDPGAVGRLVDELLAARRIACTGAGREGLMIRALCMRLMHLGLDAHMVGDMTTPPVGPGDLLLASVGTGTLATAEALIGVARAGGARTLAITAQPDGPTSRAADAVLHLPAQTMANDDDVDDGGGGTSVLPMGTLFEIAELLLFDLVALAVRDRTGQTAAQVRARHTNLE